MITSHNQMAEIGVRVKEVRHATFGVGQSSIGNVAVGMGVPAATLMNLESGISVPALVLLKFIVVTAANPSYLLHGKTPITMETKE